MGNKRLWAELETVNGESPLNNNFIKNLYHSHLGSKQWLLDT